MWKKNLTKKWKKLLAAIVALAIIIGAIFFGFDTSECEQAVKDFEAEKITLTEFYTLCEDVFEEYELEKP